MLGELAGTAKQLFSTFASCNARLEWEFVLSITNYIFDENRSKYNHFCFKDNLKLFGENYLPAFSRLWVYIILKCPLDFVARSYGISFCYSKLDLRLLFHDHCHSCLSTSLTNAHYSVSRFVASTSSDARVLVKGGSFDIEEIARMPSDIET